MEKSPETWVREIHENAVAHGWWIEDRDFGEICALIHSELSEALEEYLREYEALGFPPVSHSEIYRQCYRPAYRVLQARFLPGSPSAK